MKRIAIISACLFSLALAGTAQERPQTEDDYYRIVTIPIPETIQLEIGGLSVLPDGRVAAATRRGEVWMISNPYADGDGRPRFQRFAHGLHEPLGLLYRGKDFLLSQRGEVTRLEDTNHDGEADVYDSFSKWPLSGNYHQYSYGPVRMPNGEMLVTLNVDWVGKGASQSLWRGWMLKLGEKGELVPWATGLRSPAGFGSYQGAIFYTENQGDWVGSGRITHLEKGDFAGNPAGLRWSSQPGSPVKLKPEDIPNTGEPMYETAQKIPGLKPPAVWMPHTLMGISLSDFKEDLTNGAFGPFAGQLFVGDQGHSTVMRVDLEQVNNVWQGACFPFRKGFASGVLRLEWGLDGSLFVGQTSRGWSATGKEPFALQRLVWTGATPFEMQHLRAMPDGFEITLTTPADPASARLAESWSLNSFTYHYHQTYGSPVINQEAVHIQGVIVSDDGLKIRLITDPDQLRKGYIHELKAEGLRSREGQSLLHPVGYYTLNELPEQETADRAHMTSFGAPPAVHMHTPPTISSDTALDPATKRITVLPAAWTNGPDQVVEIGTKPGLQFDISEVKVKAGSRIKWVFNNNDDMLHNCIIAKPGAGNAIGEAALALGLKGAELQYVPVSDDILYHTNLLQPETSETIYFTAPARPGRYTYICTFPGHHFMMQGVLNVTR